MRALIIVTILGLSAFPARSGDLENRLEALELRTQEREMNDQARETNAQVEAIQRAQAQDDLERRREIDGFLRRGPTWRSSTGFRLLSEPRP